MTEAVPAYNILAESEHGGEIHRCGMTSEEIVVGRIGPRLEPTCRAHRVRYLLLELFERVSDVKASQSISNLQSV